MIVGLVFIAIVAVAGINALATEDSGVLGAGEEGDLPLAQFAVPDARSALEGDANIAQDDCEVAQIPCPEDERRTPACEVDLEGAIRVCDLFDRAAGALVLVHARRGVRGPAGRVRGGLPALSATGPTSSRSTSATSARRSTA